MSKIFGLFLNLIARFCLFLPVTGVSYFAFFGKVLDFPSHILVMLLVFCTGVLIVLNFTVVMAQFWFDVNPKYRAPIKVVLAVIAIAVHVLLLPWRLA